MMAEVLAAVWTGEVGRLIGRDERVVADAWIDGLWRALMLVGVIDLVPLGALETSGRGRALTH